MRNRRGHARRGVGGESDGERTNKVAGPDADRHDFNGLFVMDRSFVSHQLTTGDNPHWSADGHQIVFVRFEDGKNQLYRINVDGTGLTKLSTAAHEDSDPTWSPIP